MCKGQIYDILVDPLPLDHPLREYLHIPSLKRCANELADTLCRLVNIFPNGPFFFFFPQTIIEPDAYTSEYIKDERVWKKFIRKVPSSLTDINYMIGLCIDNSVARKTRAKEQFIEHFLMMRLHQILLTVPECHRLHIEKHPQPESHSLGPVPDWKIQCLKNEMRRAMSGSRPVEKPFRLGLPPGY